MIGALKQLEAGRKAEDVAREVGVSKHTIYAWKAKYGGMDVNEAQEAKQLRDENARLKKLVVDLSLDPNALYSGAKISERTLVPGNNARLGETRFETWLTQPTAQIPSAQPRANAA